MTFLRLRLAIAGAGPLRDRLERRGTQRVELLGRLEDGELADWYRAADLVVLPTLAYEGFGLATIEALAAGTPVVGTPVARRRAARAARRTSGRGGTTAGELSAAIRVGLGLLTPELRARCRSYALEHFSWDSAIGPWEDALEAAARAGHRRPGNARSCVRAARSTAAFPRPQGRTRRPRGPDARDGRVDGAHDWLPAAVAAWDPSLVPGILLYHNPAAETLERHLEYLAARHRFVPYAAIAEAARTGDWSEVPQKSLALTFDDGHAGNAALVPTLERYGVHATIFVCTGLIGTTRRFWWTIDELDPRERDRLMQVPDAERLAALERLAGWTPQREYAGSGAGTLDRGARASG